MSEIKPFLMRIDADIMKRMQKWADDELRSLNSQIEYVLRDALIRAGRAKRSGGGQNEN